MLGLIFKLLKIYGFPSSEGFAVFRHLLKYRHVTDMPRYLVDKDVEGNPYFNVTTYTLEDSEFAGYVAQADYLQAFPKYIEEFGESRQPAGVLEGKFAEHFLSLKLGNIENLAKSDVIVDVAASNSPFQQIMLKLGYTQAYKTDLNYKTNLDQKVIGSNANDLSHFPDASVSLVVSHNSWEHFEGASDIEFLEECARVLKTGGRVVIVPLVICVHGVNTTDPSIWLKKYKNAPNLPIFDKRLAVHIGKHKQRLMKFYDLKTLKASLSGLKLNFDIVQITNGKRGNYFALVGTKK